MGRGGGRSGNASADRRVSPAGRLTCRGDVMPPTAARRPTEETIQSPMSCVRACVGPATKGGPRCRQNSESACSARSGSRRRADRRGVASQRENLCRVSNRPIDRSPPLRGLRSFWLRGKPTLSALDTATGEMSASWMLCRQFPEFVPKENPEW